MTKETLKNAELQAELKQTAARLAESESRYHMLTEQSPDNILIHDLEGKILFTNASRVGLFGASSAEELIGRNAIELIHPDDRERVAGIIGGALEDFKAGKDSKRTVEQRLLRLDGTEFLGESTGVVFIYNGEPAIQAVIRDITERKRAEEELRLQGRIIRTMAEGVHLIRLSDGVIVYANPMFEEMFGYSPGELQGEHVSVLNDTDCKEQKGLDAEVFEALNKKGAWSGEVRNVKKDGTLFWCRANVTTATYQQYGEVAVTVQADITERKETEEALKESLQRHQALFENMLSGAAYHKIVLDEDGLPVDYIFLEVNSAFEEHTGLARDTVMGRAVTEVIPGIKEADPDLISIYGTVAKTGEGTTFDLYFPPLGKWFSISVYCPERGYFVSIFSDITERKRAEQELRRLKESLEKKVEQRTAKLTISNKLLGQEVAERKRAGVKLKEAEEKFRTIFESSNDAIFILGKSRVIDFNDAALQMMGYSSRVEQLGTTPADWSPQTQPDGQDSAEAAESEIAKAFKEGRNFFEWTHRRANGELFPAEVLLTPMQLDGAQVIQATVRDITERKRAEEALQVSEANLLKAQEVAHIGSWYLDLVENKLVWSAENHRIFGVPEGTRMSYEGFIEVVHPEDRGYVSRKWKAAIEGEPYDIEHRLLIDNEVKWVREKAELNLDDKRVPISAIGITQDITVRKKAEEALKESEERWQQIADNSNDFIMIIDTKSVIQYINRLMPGLTMEQVIGSNITDWVPEDFRSTMVTCVEGVLRTGEIGWFESEYVASDGTVSKFESRVGPICTNGKITELVVSAGDVTKRFNAEKEKETLYVQLLQAQKMEAIGTLAGGIAHDFNNILTVVKSLSSLALSKVPDDSPLKEYFTPIQCASDRGASLIQQLMIFAESRPPEVVELDINESIGGLLGMLSSLIDADISIEEKLGEGVWTVEGDRGRLEQVVTNLILNASDALVQGGQIEISTENVTVTKESPSMVGDMTPGKYVRLSVEDDGIGMAPEVVDHIFEPFFTTKSPAGTGLGLSVVYGIIKEMHGGIEVSSEPGLGAKFSVYLPAIEFPVETSVPVEAVEAYGGEAAGGPCSEGAGVAAVALGGAGEAVLLVEDDEWVRSSTALALRENGYTVTEAADADSALVLFENAVSRFALILSDVVMPGRDGLQMVEDLLQIAPAVPVLFYSGHIDDRARLDSILKRGFAFLQKPYEIPDLLKAVKECMAEG
jgi:PAS domain S-box-containing protein